MEGTGLYAYGFRYYDPVIGRFTGVDPLADHPNQVNKSPYQYAWNNPVTLNDPDGRCPICPLLAKAGASVVVDIGAQVIVNHYLGGQSWNDAFSNIDWGQAGISGLEGLNPFSMPGGKIGKAFATALSDVAINAYRKDDYTIEEAMQDALVGFIAQVGPDAAGDFFKKYADDGIEFTADLSKSKARSRSGHRNAGNKQLFEAMQADPKLRNKLKDRLGNDVFDRTSTSGSGRRNPQGYEWDHNSNDANKLDLRSKENHAEKTTRDPGRQGGYSKYWKDKE